MIAVATCSDRSTSARRGRWLVDPGFGVYVHIPFCLHRCHYCDFNTYEGLEALYEPYVAALCRHISEMQGDYPEATSVFFGGGTPTLLEPRALGRILDRVRERIGLAPDAEVTIEANPETVTVGNFEALLEAGFNRVSIGVQSLRPEVLKALGRRHDPGRALKAIADARAAGVTDINADLIYGSPWEARDDWRASLEGAIAAGTDHISAYALTIEEGTPLATLVRTGRVPNVDPDIQADRFEVASSVLAGAGFQRYEVSNWCTPGRASAHNVLYWSAGNYLGVGAGAHGHLDGHRYWSERLPREFIDRVEAGRSPVAGEEHVSLEERAAEAVMLGLRLSSGIDLEGFSLRFGGHLVERAERIEELISSGLLERVDGRLRVTERGTFRTDAVIAHIS